MKRIFSFSLIFLFLIFSRLTFFALADDSSVLVIEINDTIDQSTVELIKGGFAEGKNLDVEAIVITLDTPGGGVQQTYDIAEMIYNSPIPVIGYVYPRGSVAWSAGTFILMSTHIAAMSNNTIIGSCQPVTITFEGTKTVNDSKIINALVEWIQERARMYDRNETLAKEFITLNRNINSTLAEEYGIVEFISPSIDSLLEKIDGYTAKTSKGDVILNTKDANQIIYNPSLAVQLMKILSNPILTSLLLMLGIFCILFGISSPGFGAEVFGVIAILLSLLGSGFAISTLTIIFLIIGCFLLIIEIFVIPGFGVIGIGGIISLVLGFILLVPNYSPPNKEWMISMDWINNVILLFIVVAILLSIFFVFLLYKVIEIRGKKKAVGVFIGEKATTIDAITPEKPGYVRFKGEYWKATSDSSIEPNIKVIIVGKDESTLIVKKI